METKDIQKLLDFISRSNLEEVNIETEHIKLKTKRSQTIKNSFETVTHSTPVQVAAAPAVAPVVKEEAKPETAPVADPNANYIEVKSPMIGTFYRASGPDKPNFVEVGDDISEGQVFCIIEAMKLFNEIESEVSGKIVKILVNDATPVEFDQPLFLVDPS